MIGSWWFLWAIFMCIFLVSPVGYGWAYRGWGPPYPRYLQRRRGARAEAAAAGGPATFNHHSWGWGGDFVWIMLMVAVFWGVSAFWWR
jgi:hypothetical protein